MHTNTALFRLLPRQLPAAHLALRLGRLAADAAGGAAILAGSACTARLAALGVLPLLGTPTLQVRAGLRLPHIAAGLPALSRGLRSTR